MKKSLFALSAFILAFTFVFASCGETDVFTDEYNNTHIAVTEKNGVTKQDKFGHLYEVITDANGKTRTQVYDFPAAMTNKSQSWIENGVLRFKVPSGWKLSGLDDRIRLCHSGDCTETGNSNCEINATYKTMAMADEVYDDVLFSVNKLINTTGLCGELQEFETDLFGTKSKAVSYKFYNNGITCYHFIVQKEIPVITFEIYVYKDCYTKDEIVELLNEYCTIKDLGGELPTTTTTTTTAAAE